jgi:hypothetical protein
MSAPPLSVRVTAVTALPVSRVSCQPPTLMYVPPMQSRLSLRVDSSDLEIWKAEARTQGITLTEFVRLRLNGGKRGKLSEGISAMVAAEIERQVPAFADRVMRDDGLVDLITVRVRQQLQGATVTGVTGEVTSMPFVDAP